MFSFFINYMTAEVPAVPAAWKAGMTSLSSHSNLLHGWLLGWFETNKAGVLSFSNKGASDLASLGFVLFLVGRFSGASLLKKCSAHKMLGLYGVLNVIMTFLVFCKLGWLFVICVFLSYFFMSIMFPTIFALGIFGLGARAKKARRLFGSGFLDGGSRFRRCRPFCRPSLLRCGDDPLQTLFTDAAFCLWQFRYRFHLFALVERCPPLLLCGCHPLSSSRAHLSFLPGRRQPLGERERLISAMSDALPNLRHFGSEFVVLNLVSD
jgi:hypothetical protein